MNLEMKSKKWLFGGILFQLLVGYTVSYLIYTIGTLIVAPSTLNALPAIIGLIVVLLTALFVTITAIKNNKKQSS